MTNLEAIQSVAIGYPIDANTFLRILLDRGLDAQSDYAGKSKAFELAHADVLISLITAANMSEGGFSVSISEKSNFLKVASGLYEKHGEVNPLADKQPTVQGGSPW